MSSSSNNKRKRHTPEQVIAKLREAEAMLASGKSVAQGLPGAGGQRGDLSPLEERVRRDEGRRAQAAEGSGGGEPPAQARGGGPDAGQADPQGGDRSPGKRVSWRFRSVGRARRSGSAVRAS